MTYSDCLSVMELLEFRNAGEAADHEARAHLNRCPRCTALLERLPEVRADEALRLPASLPEAPARRESQPGPDEIRVGQLWLATAPSQPDWSCPVAVIGRPRQRPGTALVAPVAEEIEEASDLDLMIERSPLGYRHLIGVWDYGSVFEHQLKEYVGALSDQEKACLVALYRHIVAGDPFPRMARVGPSLAGADDPRRRFRDLLLERTRPLYGPVREAALNEAPQPSEGEAPAAAGDPTFGSILAGVLAGPDWDRQTLLETAQLSGTELDRFLSDSLDLTTQQDVEPLARTIRVLDLDVDEVREPVMLSLAVSPGGQLRAGNHEFAAAARAFSCVSEEEVTRDLYRRYVDIDQAPEARRRAIDAYWQALVEKLEEL